MTQQNEAWQEGRLECSLCWQAFHEVWLISYIAPPNCFYYFTSHYDKNIHRYLGTGVMICDYQVWGKEIEKTWCWGLVNSFWAGPELLWKLGPACYQFGWRQHFHCFAPILELQQLFPYGEHKNCTMQAESKGQLTIYSKSGKYYKANKHIILTFQRHIWWMPWSNNVQQEDLNLVHFTRSADIISIWSAWEMSLAKILLFFLHLQFVWSKANTCVKSFNIESNKDWEIDFEKLQLIRSLEKLQGI